MKQLIIRTHNIFFKKKQPKALQNKSLDISSIKIIHKIEADYCKSAKIKPLVKAKQIKLVPNKPQR